MICKNYFLEAWRAAGRTPSEPCRSHQYRKIELSCRKMLLIINSLKQDSAAWSVYFHLRQTAGVRLWSAALKEDGGEESDAGLHSSSLFGEEQRRGRPTDSRCQVFILKLYSSTFCSSCSGSSNHLPSTSTNCCFQRFVSQMVQRLRHQSQSQLTLTGLKLFFTQKITFKVRRFKNSEPLRLKLDPFTV